MIYILITILLISAILIYFKIADKYNIIDKPNERSSHNEVTIRGGGIIIWLAALFYFIVNFSSDFYFFIGITLVSFISFYDDIKSLPGNVRALMQFVAVIIIFYGLNIFSIFPWWIIAISIIISIGIINAYNFMDGINGITGLYSIVIFSSLLYVNNYIVFFINNDFFIFPIIACIIFLFFNFRIKAKCFAGDIGSVSIAFWIIYSLTKLIVETNSIIWILFLAVYGVDSICTIIHRLYIRQNIYEPHRMHFYQILSNEYKIDHRLVSIGYAILQIFISVIVLATYDKDCKYFIFVGIIFFLAAIYSCKFILLKKWNHT